MPYPRYINPNRTIEEAFSLSGWKVLGTMLSLAGVFVILHGL